MTISQLSQEPYMSISHLRYESPTPTTAYRLTGIRIRVDAPARHPGALNIKTAFVALSWRALVLLGDVYGIRTEATYDQSIGH